MQYNLIAERHMHKKCVMVPNEVIQVLTLVIRTKDFRHKVGELI